MHYQEFNTCIEILKNKPGWFFQQDNIEPKLECLEKIKSDGIPSNIHGLVPFLRDENQNIRLKTAEVIIALFRKLNSQNQWYDSLKYLPINNSDVDSFLNNYSGDISVNLLAISSLNHSGYVRQSAVEALAKSKHPDAIRFVLIRLGDWVKNVRKSASEAIQEFFTVEYLETFIRELKLVGALLTVKRVNLSAQYQVILNFILSDDLTSEFYYNLKVPASARLLYVKSYIEQKGFAPSLGQLLASDKNFLIRLEVIKHLKKLDQPEKEHLIKKLLFDPSSQVRLSALYSIKGIVENFVELITALTSDPSTSVRELSRYLLKDKDFEFRKIYRERIIRKESILGSLLGLADVGSHDDLEVFKEFINHDDVRIKIACLIAFQKLSLPISKTFALQLFLSPSTKVRGRCIEILSHAWDEEVYEASERIYNKAQFIRRLQF